MKIGKFEIKLSPDREYISFAKISSGTKNAWFGAPYKLPKDNKIKYEDIEIAYRISQRISFFLSSDRKEAKELFKAAKNSYRWRSKIAHGMRLDKCEQKESAQILYNTEDFVRRSLNKILNNAELVRIFSNNKEREEYLDNLVFSISPER